ncbi:MAG: 4-hydroxy-tetrahydrodipicolinate synthase [Candidatus Cloacimonetes bacterium]|nr:4-hydroxy-tetrahydrodipicolinate synthase [Candidatus Cloacimonadota bacterium]
MLKGSIVALVTPFKKGKIDYNAVDRLLDMHLAAKTDGILLCGTTGESPALAGDEKEFFVNYCLHKLEKRLPVIVGTGTNNLSKTISATTKAQSQGADYALVITPYYNKPTQNGLYQYFKAVAENVAIPLIIYNVPGRTGVNITSATTLRLAHDFPGIVGIKESSANLVQTSEIVKGAPEGFFVLSGEDALNMPLMSCGAVGTVSVTANIVPEKIRELTHYCLEGNYLAARKQHLELLELNAAMFLETSPIPVKEALAMMGIIEREFRLPMCFLQEENYLKLQAVLQKYKLVK